MTKKKNRQQDPGSQGEESSDSGDEQNQGGGTKSCLHTSKGVDPTGVKKGLVLNNSLLTVCADCSLKGPIERDNENGEEEKKDEEKISSMWLCLRCGYQACGPPSNKNSHISKHFQTPRSVCHALCTDTDNWTVWCQDCDIEIGSSSSKKLQEVLDNLKRKNKSDNPVIKPKRNLTLDLGENNVDLADDASSLSGKNRNGSKSVTLATSPSPSPTNSHPKVKGLSNLGNTCFFNAVLQCLAQTPYLVNLLKETSAEGEKFCLPGCPNDSDPVPPLEGELGTWGSLTEALAEILTEMQDPNGSTTVNPRKLLSVISQKAPHLASGDQQDSQELLRHLMEGVRTEELKRFQKVILEKNGLSTRTDPNTVDDETKAKAKVYSQQASKLLLRPDHLFQGRLVSILQCQDCYRQSVTTETFLDLSLPIASERPQPPYIQRNSRHRESESESTTSTVNNKEKEAPSKHQLKKEKRLAQKNRKKKGSTSRQNSVDPGENNEEENNNDSEESKESDADVEDNEETETDPNKKQMDVSNKSEKDLANHALEGIIKEDKSGGGESGYATNGGTHSNSPDSPNSANEEQQEGGGGASATVLCCELQTLALNVPTDVDEVDKPAKIEQNSIENEIKENGEVTEMKEEVEKEEAEEEVTGACALKKEESPDEDEASDDTWNQTLALKTPTTDNDGECSIQSCLNQFAAIELLTGNNKVSCKTCTKRAGKSAQGKTVCTNSTKQLLVSAPPAILTLHLKRFEVVGARFRKVSKTVNFPLILDLASICSEKCKDLPTVSENQTKILYSLYGVVEHSGGLACGHYVAYVKTRAQPDKNDPRSKFLLSNTWEKRSDGDEEEVDIIEGAEGGLPEPPPGKWYYISDSRYNEVSEKKVLQTQAYLLFYERIL